MKNFDFTKTKTLAINRPASEHKVTEAEPDNDFFHKGAAHSFSKVDLQQSNKLSGYTARIQPKLKINQPNDIYEQEAEAMADKVMRTQDGPSYTSSLHHNGLLQRKCKHCEEEEEVQRKESRTASPKPMQAENFTTSLSGGNPLNKNELHFYGSKMRHDFSKVRLHTDEAANESAKSIDALAYTHGNDIVFGAHQYQPDTAVGKRLLAHELTHVIQQERNLQNTIQKASVKIGKKDFMEGDCIVNAAARKDITTHGNLLAGKDQAHIAVTKSNKLAYEINYTDPEDPFRWSIIKNVIDNEHVEIYGVSASTNFNTLILKTASETPIKDTQSLAALNANGIFLITKSKLLIIDPTAKDVPISTSSTHHQIYYETGAKGRGAIGSNSLAHELFGHLGLAIQNVPFTHGKSLAGTKTIKDPLGSSFSGNVNDYVSNFAGESKDTVLQSPTLGVSPNSLQSTLDWITGNGASHIIANQNSIDAALDLKLQILSNNYDILLMSAQSVNIGNTSINAKDIEDRLVKWAQDLTDNKRATLKSVLKRVTQGFGNKTNNNRRVQLFKAILPRL